MSLVVPTIETERLVLRGWRESDFAPLAAFYADDPASVYVGGPRKSREVVMWFMARLGQWALRGYGAFVISERTSGDFAGWCGANHYVGMPEPSLQWALAAPYRGKGYMVEAGRHALTFVFEASARTTLHTTIHPSNAASQRTAQHLGGAPSGAHEIDAGETVDVWRFSRSGGAQ